MLFPLDEYEQRWQRVDAEMTARGLDAAVVWSRSFQSLDRAGDVLYLTNHYAPEAGPDAGARRAWGHYAVILERGQVPELVAEAADCRGDLVATDRITWADDVIGAVARRLRERGLRGEVGLVGTTVLPYRYGCDLVAETSEIAWREEEGLVAAVRRVKSERELDCMRTGGANAAVGLDMLMQRLVDGEPERDAVAAAVSELYRRGNGGSYVATNHGDTIGYWTRSPLLGRSADPARPGELVRGWLDTTYEGYCFDPGRTAVCGSTATADQRALIDDCAAIVASVVDAVRPGTTGGELMAATRAAVAAVGGDDGPTSTAYPVVVHGIGLSFEGPFISADHAPDGARIEAGMTMGVEYFLTRDGVGTAGIEENFIVGVDANESLIGLPLTGW